MTRQKLSIKKGDNVVIRTGKDKGATGEVTQVMPDERKVLVQGVNQVTKHRKPGGGSPGGIEKIEKPIDVSNVAVADPKTGKATRVGTTWLKDGRKVRYAKVSGEQID